MKTVRLGQLYLLCWLCITAAYASDPKTRVKEVLEGRDNTGLTDVAEAEKPAIRAELKNYLRGNMSAFSPQATKELIKLGDIETVESQIEAFHNASSLRKAHQAATLLSLSSDANVISRVADDLFRNESPTEVHDKVSFEYPISILATGIILSVGERSPQLPESVRTSMRLAKTLQPADQRETLRRWWTANRQAFSARQYASVAPPR
jgi:hypothetical protein